MLQIHRDFLNIPTIKNSTMYTYCLYCVNKWIDFRFYGRLHVTPLRHPFHFLDNGICYISYYFSLFVYFILLPTTLSLLHYRLITNSILIIIAGILELLWVLLLYLSHTPFCSGWWRLSYTDACLTR